MTEITNAVVITGASSGFGEGAVRAFTYASPGKRRTRTVVAITWGVDEVNAFTQPRQDALLKEMQLDAVLGGADA